MIIIKTAIISYSEVILSPPGPLELVGFRMQVARSTDHWVLLVNGYQASDSHTFY